MCLQVFYGNIPRLLGARLWTTGPKRAFYLEVLGKILLDMGVGVQE